MFTQKCLSLSNQKCQIQSTLINLHLMNTLKGYITISLWLIWIDVSQVVILLMTCLIKYVFQTKHKIYI